MANDLRMGWKFIFQKDKFAAKNGLNKLLKWPSQSHFDWAFNGIKKYIISREAIHPILLSLTYFAKSLQNEVSRWE